MYMFVYLSLYVSHFVCLYVFGTSSYGWRCVQHIYIYIYIYIYTHTHTHTHKHTHRSEYMHINLHVCSTHSQLDRFQGLSACIYVWMRVYMYTLVYLNLASTNNARAHANKRHELHEKPRKCSWSRGNHNLST
jgi:hypothetical protein